MKVSELIKKCNYKQVFNIVYKKYLINKSPEQVIRVDLEIQKAYNFISKVACSPEITKDSHSVYVLFAEGEQVDVCIHDEESDELCSLDLYDWTQLACLEFKKGCKLSSSEIAAEILWEITHWGDNEDIKKLLKDIDDTINNLTKDD
jgi:hypothetical protein